MKTKLSYNLFLLSFLFTFIACNKSKLQLPDPQYNPGIAVLHGKIKNYNSDNKPELKIGIPNLIMEVETIYPEIQEDGSFIQNIPLQYAMQIALAIDKQQQYIFMSPEDTTSYLKIDLQTDNQEQQFIYEGTYAELNRDFNHRLKGRCQPYYFDNEILKKTYKMSPFEFRNFCMKDIKEAISYNNKRKDACQEAKELANRSYALDVLEYLKHPDYFQRSGAMLVDKISREESIARYAEYTLPENYYDVLKEFPLNDPLSVYCFNFAKSIPVIGDFCLKAEDKFAYFRFFATNAPITDDERELINDYIQNSGNGFSRDSELMPLAFKYEAAREKYLQIEFEKAQQRLVEIYGDSTLPIFEFMKIRSASISFKNYKPLSEEQELLFSDLTNPLCIGVLEDLNMQMKPKKRDAEVKYIICENPNVPKDEILNEIIRTHQGKVILIDLWATWCSGCRRLIKEFAPSKSDFNKEDVVFVYLTNESSPEKLWKKLIPDIEGYHYRLGTEHWDYFWKRFEMKGLPLYIIIDKDGNIASHFVYTTVKELKEKMEELVS